MIGKSYLACEIISPFGSRMYKTGSKLPCASFPIVLMCGAYTILQVPGANFENDFVDPGDTVGFSIVMSFTRFVRDFVASLNATGFSNASKNSCFVELDCRRGIALATDMTSNDSTKQIPWIAKIMRKRWTGDCNDRRNSILLCES